MTTAEKTHEAAQFTARDAMARDMAARSLGRNVAAARLVECRKCGEIVAMTQSRRTGNWYTADLMDDVLTPVFHPARPHFKTCSG